jgi:hypothetical protein
MKQAFPEFSSVPHIGGQFTLSRQIISGNLEQAWRQAAKSMPENLAPFIGKLNNPTLEKLKRGAMFMFTQSEMFNRHAAFEGALWKGMNEGLTVLQKGKKVASPQAIKLAAQTVRATQFAMGPGQMPHGLLNVSAPWRQFMYFPARYAGFLWESMRQGKGLGWTTKAGKRQFGTIGRAVAASETARIVGKNLLDMDLSGGLMGGALPFPGIPGTPLYPAPVVPPIFSVPSLIVQAAQTQTTGPLQQAGALLVPGGVAGLRAYKSGALPALGIPIGKKFADWDKKDEQGRVPVYDSTGKLITKRTPMHMFMKAAGVNPNDVVREREMVSYLLRHRDQIRDIRRQYVDAVYDNDPTKASRMQESFKQQYPDMGNLYIKKSDMTAAKKRREMTRLQRLLQTFPKEYRGEFEKVVGTAMSAEMSDQFGQSPPPTPLVDTGAFQGLMNMQLPQTPGYGSFPGLGGSTDGSYSNFSFGPQF